MGCRGRLGEGRFSAKVREFKAELVRSTLVEHGGSRTAAARALGMNRTYLQRLMVDFGVDVPPNGRKQAAALTAPNACAWCGSPLDLLTPADADDRGGSGLRRRAHGKMDQGGKVERFGLDGTRQSETAVPVPPRREKRR